jgi:thiamine-phosphate pyrophosphorylase
MLAQTRPPSPGESELTVLTRFIEEAVESGVDLVQIRERDLSAREVYNLTEAVVRIAEGSQTRVLVNDRADIAASLGAGVHLTTRSMNPRTVRDAFGEELLIGVSTHNIAEVELAEQGGADFVVFGPVFQTDSKAQYGPPVGIASLREAVSRAGIPILALGGITISKISDVLEAGAAGFAGISVFATSRDLKGLVRQTTRHGG